MAEPTSRELLETVLRGEMPPRVPFAPNIGQWYSAHQRAGTLPEELKGCKDELEAMLTLGCDVITRRCGPGVGAAREGYEVRGHQEPDGTHVQEYVTPVGVLRGRSRWEEGSHTSYTAEHLVKQFPADYPALRYVVEHTEYAFDHESHGAAAQRLGDRGLLIVPLAQSPIKMLHNFAGQQQATILMMDHEELVQELFEIHTEKVLAVAQQCARSQAVAFMTMDNLDSLFHSPLLFKRFALGFYQRLAEALHAGGKYLFSHACGQLRGLKALLAESGLDGLEAVTHPPLGDLPLREAQREIRPGLVVMGGMSCHEQELFDGARERIRQYVRDLFEQLRPFQSFIFSSG